MENAGLSPFLSSKPEPLSTFQAPKTRHLGVKSQHGNSACDPTCDGVVGSWKGALPTHHPISSLREVLGNWDGGTLPARRVPSCVSVGQHEQTWGITLFKFLSRAHRKTAATPPAPPGNAARPGTPVCRAASRAHTPTSSRGTMPPAPPNSLPLSYLAPDVDQCQISGSA